MEPTSKDHREYLEAQAPLRAAWLDESLPPAERAEAKKKLHALVEDFKRRFPPITGTFTYTPEQAEQAKQAGF